MKFEWQKELSLSIALGLLTLVAFGFLFEEGAVPYSPHSDFIAEHLPLKHAAYASMSSGHGLPFWRSDMLSGGPALTNPQALYSNPLQLPFLWSPPAEAAGPSIWLHFLAMALSMQVLGGALGLGWLARIFVAVAGLFSFKLIIMTYAGWLPVLPGFVTAPLLMAALLKTIDRPGVAAALWLTTGGVLGLQSGHLQVTYYVTLMFGVYVMMVCLAKLRAAESTEARQLLVTCIASVVVAGLSSAFLFVPLFSEIDLTARTTSDYEFLQSGGVYAARNLATFIHPEILGSPLDGTYAPVGLWENVAYFGVIAQILAVAGAILGGHRRHVRFLTMGLIASVVLSFDSFLLRAAYEWVPGFSLFRIPSRFLFLTTLFGIALAGIGFEELLAKVRARIASAHAPRIAMALGALMIIGTAGEGIAYVDRYITMAPIENVIPDTRYGRLLAEDNSLFRVAPLGRHALNYGWGASMGLELVTGFEPYNYRHYQRYLGVMTFHRRVEPAPVVWVDVTRVARWDFLDALNVKYLVAAQELDVVPLGLARIAGFEDEPVFAFYEGLSTSRIVVYENKNVRPRVYWANKVVVVEDADAAMNVALKVKLDKRTIVESTPVGERTAVSSERDLLKFSKPTAGEVQIDAVSEQGGFAVISEVWHPGWTATLDGKPLKVLRTNIALMGVWIPPGEHRVELRFRPLHFDAALGLTGLGVAGLVALVLANLRRVSNHCV